MNLSTHFLSVFHHFHEKTSTYGSNATVINTSSLAHISYRSGKLYEGIQINDVRQFEWGRMGQVGGGVGARGWPTNSFSLGLRQWRGCGALSPLAPLVPLPVPDSSHRTIVTNNKPYFNIYKALFKQIIFCVISFLVLLSKKKHE